METENLCRGISKISEGHTEETEGYLRKEGFISENAVITGIEGTTVDGMDALQEHPLEYKGGEKVKITVQTQSKNGEYEKKDVEVTLGKQSE